jgi:hypothetical protein
MTGEEVQMAKNGIRLALVLLLAAALNAAALPSFASAQSTRPSGSSGGSSGRTASRGSAAVTRGGGSGQASGHATYGYHGRGYNYGYGYGYGYHQYPYYWYLGYPGMYYWHWGWPYLFDGYYPAIYQVVRTGSAPGVVETAIKPKKAEVLVDGQVVGEARDFNGKWDQLFLKPGSRSIEFRKPGYMTLTLWLDVPAGGYIRIEESLAEGEGPDPRSMEQPAEPEKRAPERAPEQAIPQGLLRIEASPADAAIYLDGEFLARAEELGRLHGALPVALGRHVIEVVRPGYEGTSFEIVVDQERPQKVRIDLERKSGAAVD